MIQKIFFFILFLGSLNAQELQKVTLQLKWKHQFQFAGYYAALHKGYYRDAGVDVVIKEANHGINMTQEIVSKNAHFGVGTSSLVLDFAKGEQIVVLGVIFQHSPFALMSLQENIQTIHDLVNKTLMIEDGSADIYALLKRENIDIKSLNIVEHSFNTQKLIDKEVDSMSVYSIDEPYYLQSEKIRYNLFSPREAGIDFYGDNLFTTKEMVESNPKLVEAFKSASLKGWQYALSHQEEIIELILKYYNTQKKPKEYLEFEANHMKGLIHPEILEIGYMYQGRWEHIVSVYQELGFLDDKINLNDFLYSTKKDFFQEYKTFLTIFVGLIFLLLLSWYIAYKLKKKVQEEVAKNIEQSKKVAMSNMVANISHQWKEPLIQISATNHFLLHHCSVSQEIDKKLLEEKLFFIDKMVVFMSETMQNFLDFYKGSNKEEKFSIQDSIEKSLQIIADKIVKYNVEINLSEAFDFSIVGRKTDFLQVWLNLINNSIDAGVKKDIKNINIKITIEKGKITFQDNCGGCENIEQIFSQHNCGLGLKMCKEIMEKNSFDFIMRNFTNGLEVCCTRLTDNPPLQY